METISVPMVEYSVASFTLRGQGESGDDHLVCCNRSGVLLAAIDGIGHGKDAAEAAKAAASILRSSVNCSVMAELAKELTEVIVASPLIWPNCRSSGVVTEEAITSGLAPGYCATTWMVG